MGLTKRIKNDTGATVTFIGQDIAVGAYYTLQGIVENEEWGTDADVVAAINASDLIVNDGAEDLTDPAVGLKYLASISATIIADGATIATNVDTPSDGDIIQFSSSSGNWEKVASTSMVGDTIGGTSDTSVFFDDGSLSADAFLKRTNNHTEKSDGEPYECKFDLKVIGLSYMNKIDNSDADIKVYKNAVLLFTWNLIDARHAFKTDGLSSLTFVAGDLISVEGCPGTTVPNDVIFEMDMSYSAEVEQEVVSATL